MIVAAAPLVSAGIAICVFHERLTYLKAAGITLAILGVALVCLSRSGLSATPAVWVVIAAAVSQGIYHPLSKRLLTRYTGLELATYAMVAATIMTLPFLPSTWPETPSSRFFADLVGGRSLWGCCPMALSTVLWGYAVARLPADDLDVAALSGARRCRADLVRWLGEVQYPKKSWAVWW